MKITACGYNSVFTYLSGVFAARLDCILMKPCFKIHGKEGQTGVMNCAAFGLYLFHFLIEIALFWE